MENRERVQSTAIRLTLPDALRRGGRGHRHRQPASHVSCGGSSLCLPNFPRKSPFWPQLPQLSERESIVSQGLGIVENLIEPRKEGYGYQVKEGQLDSVLEILHRSSGELTPANAAGFGAFEEALSSGLFSSAIAVKGQIEGPITLSAYLFHKGRPFLADPALFAAVAFHVSQIIGWQIDRLKSSWPACAAVC